MDKVGIPKNIQDSLKCYTKKKNKKEPIIMQDMFEKSFTLV